MSMDITLSRRELHINWQKIVAIAALAVVFVAITWAAYLYIQLDTDWSGSYKPATLTLLQGQSPYTRWGIFVPPWTFAALAPFAILPAQLGRALLFTVSLAAFAFVSIRLKAKPIALVAILFSYPVLFSLMYGQVDWLVVIGLVLVPRYGVFFLSIKPQAGLGPVVFRFVEEWRDKGMAALVRLCAPLVVAFLLSFAAFGLWPLNMPDVNMGVSMGLWPYGVPVGLALLFFAIRRRKYNLAILASPFLSPYLPPQGLIVVLLGLLPSQWAVVAASIGTWILRYFAGQFLN